MGPQAWPLLLAENHNSNLAAREILLITHSLISRQQYVETVRLGDCEQFAILQLVPSLLCSRCGPRVP